MSASDDSAAAARVEGVIRPDVRSMSAYVVPPAAGMVKLDAMENPYTLSPRARQELARLLAEAPINRYPDAGASHLKAQLRRAMDIPLGADILLGNGSDEILLILAMAVAQPRAAMLSVEPSFVMYRSTAQFAQIKYVGVPLQPDFSLDFDAVLDAMRREQPALTYFAYPNNPTGNLFSASEIERLIRVAPGLVVIDEAYHAFAEQSFLPRVMDFPNLIVVRTLSKLGLAGLRLGFAVGAPEWIRELEKLRLPYNINTLTQIAASAVLEFPQTLAEQAAAIRASREELFKELGRFPQGIVYPSRANFLLFRINEADRVHQELKRNGVLVKNLHGSHPLLANCLRITVGAPEENQVLLQKLHLICD